MNTNQSLANTLNEPEDCWIYELWAWADENDISDDTLPRDKEKLTNLTELYLSSNQFVESEVDKIAKLKANCYVCLTNRILIDNLDDDIPF